MRKVMLQLQLSLTPSKHQGQRTLGCIVFKYIPTKLVNWKFQQLSKETKILKIEQYLAITLLRIFRHLKNKLEKILPHLLLYYIKWHQIAISKFAVIFWAPKTASLEDLVHSLKILTRPIFQLCKHIKRVNTRHRFYHSSERGKNLKQTHCKMGKEKSKPFIP